MLLLGLRMGMLASSLNGAYKEAKAIVYEMKT